MMTYKEYGIAVALGLFSLFAWLILLVNIGTLFVNQEINLFITFFNSLNVAYVFALCILIFGITVIFMIYLLKYGGMEKEIKEAKARGEYGNERKT